MKKFTQFLIVFFFACCLIAFNTSCKKKDIEQPEQPAETVRPVGEPIDAATTETIDNNGGIVKSQDGQLEIEIPAGALSQPTDISIQPVKNTAVSGIGFSYRLTPHGKVFQKKVTIRFHYLKQARRLSSKQPLEIAWQNEKGIWTCTGGTTNDTLHNTISVQTDHFSDWALIAAMELTPVIKTVGLSESVPLKAVLYVHPLNEDNDLLIPLTVPNATNGVATKLDAKYIVKWTLNGPGTLTGNGADAVYTAPSAKPANKTAVVTLELNVHGTKVLLISTIHIIDEGISISIDGGAWNTYPGMAVTMPSLQRYNISSLRTTTDIPQIVFQWPQTAAQKADGVWGWNMLGEEGSHVVFEYSDGSLNSIYASVYDDDVDTYDSPGFLSVEEMEEGGKKYLTGYFAVDKAGLIDAATGQQVKVSGIMGTFKVQRNW